MLAVAWSSTQSAWGVALQHTNSASSVVRQQTISAWGVVRQHTQSAWDIALAFVLAHETIFIRLLFGIIGYTMGVYHHLAFYGKL